MWVRRGRGRAAPVQLTKVSNTSLLLICHLTARQWQCGLEEQLWTREAESLLDGDEGWKSLENEPYMSTWGNGKKQDGIVPNTISLREQTSHSAAYADLAREYPAEIKTSGGEIKHGHHLVSVLVMYPFSHLSAIATQKKSLKHPHSITGDRGPCLLNCRCADILLDESIVISWSPLAPLHWRNGRDETQNQASSGLYYLAFTPGVLSLVV